MPKRVERSVVTNSGGRALWQSMGRRLEMRRTQLGLGASQVAGQLAISPAQYQQYEAGSAQTPALLLGDIARLYQVPVTWFFQELPLDDTPGASDAAGEQPESFAVATDEERVQMLADHFRSLRFDDQQYVLTIARTLALSNKGPQAR